MMRRIFPSPPPSPTGRGNKDGSRRLQPANLPNNPGVYIMRDAANRIIYIGKADNLKKRVSSYFNKQDRGPKIAALLSNIHHIDYVVCASSTESLLLEQRLIRQRQPVYNTMWKDDKSYPFLKLTVNTDFPRFYITRQRIADGSFYFGPYPNVGQVRKLLKWIWRKKLFPLRPCKLEFSQKRLPEPKKVQSCLYLHTGECPAPCVAKISKKGYGKIVKKAILFLDGKYSRLLKIMRVEMKTEAKNLNFENAKILRDAMKTIEYMSETPVSLNLRQAEDFNLSIGSSEKELISLKETLNLDKLPLRIEAYDISHIFGKDAVGSMITFEKGLPFKDGYRKFRIKTVKGIDDFAMIAEVVKRRFARLLDEGGRWPDLALIDGGKGQLNAAIDAIKSLNIVVPAIAALAKQEEEIYLPGRNEPLRLNADSPALLLLERIRNEAHRFAVAYHHVLHKKALLKYIT